MEEIIDALNESILWIQEAIQEAESCGYGDSSMTDGMKEFIQKAISLIAKYKTKEK